MEAGKLRHQVSIEEPNETRDSVGGVVINWVDVATVWTEIHPLSGQELEVAKTVYADVTHRVTMRYFESDRLTNKHRFKFGTRILNIISILNVDERNDEMQIMAKENLV